MPEKKNKKKQPYQKPVIKVIELAADEMLTGGCKMAGSYPGGALGSSCQIGPTNCPTLTIS